MDLCHLEHSEVAELLKKCNGRVALRGDTVKDDTGCQAVFLLNKKPSASQMTAAKLLDTVSRPPGVAGETNDAVSAYTRITMKDVPRLLKLLETECSIVWIMLPRSRRPPQFDQIDDPVPLAESWCERKLEELLFQDILENLKRWELLKRQIVLFDFR